VNEKRTRDTTALLRSFTTDLLEQRTKTSPGLSGNFDDESIQRMGAAYMLCAEKWPVAFICDEHPELRFEASAVGCEVTDLRQKVRLPFHNYVLKIETWRWSEEDFSTWRGWPC
jgi:hypothetical protein